MKIEDIKNEKFIKNLNNEELSNLASDMRKFIIEKVSKTGGHLSSNLGVIDLTIALAKVFDFDKDIILFDVGHQSYPYKILTGRASRFDTLRKKDGLSGFQSLNESTFDHYEVGHSSTSISSGVGFALARDMDKKNHHIISIIGDGSISNGLAYEALNHLGDIKTKQIIILNDNQMSISKNVGAIHNTLDSIRANKNYENAKTKTKKILYKTYIGRPLIKLIDVFKRNLKKIYLKKGIMFNELGIEYYGPINGHDYSEMIKYLNIAKNEDKPVILHVITQKGKGYKYAEEDNIGKYHGINSFNIETGEEIKNTDLPSYSEIISSYIYNYAKKDDSIICITPAMAYGSKLNTIAEKLPKQFIDVGIAEEHSLVMANTLALSGKKPYVFIYSTFLQRGYDMLLHDIARSKSDVTLCIDRAGLVPADGSSHQGIYDIPMMMSIPNIVLSMPKDSKEANDLIYTSLNYKGPFAIRYAKTNTKYSYTKGTNLEIGSWEVIKQGNDGIIITYGPFVQNAQKITEFLEKDQINIGIINARFLKPIDKKLFNEILKYNKPIIVYEESPEIGSLGSVLLLEASKTNFNNQITVIGIKDSLVHHASRKEIIESEKLDEMSVYNLIKKMFR